MTTVLLKSLVFLGVANTPYPKHLTVIPSLEIEHQQGFIYLRQESSARCNPFAWNRFDPITAKWSVEGGALYAGARIGVGHTSEHGVDKPFAATESFDYLRLEYRLEFN